MRKSRRWLLLALVLVILGGIAYKVSEIVGRVQKEIKNNPLTALDYLPESALQIKEFHRSKIEDGRKVWELFGDEANYYKDRREAVIKKPRFFYYDKEGEVASTKGDQAIVYLNEKELERMELKGDIEVSFQGYVLKSEAANYTPAKEQIVLPHRTTVVGDGIAIEGARMEVELEERKIRLIQAVKTRIEPEKLGKKKAPVSDRAAIGG